MTTDFERYWNDTLNDLARYPTAPEVELLPMRCADFATMYAVRLTSVGAYRLFGYLSVPQGEGPFPAIYFAPKYQSVLEPIPQGAANFLRSRFVVFALGWARAKAVRQSVFGGLSRSSDRGNRRCPIVHI